MPGTVDGWARLQNRFGRMTLAQVLQPSIEAARQGFGLTERIRGDWESYDGFYVDMLKKDPESRKVFLRDGHVPALYSIFRNPDLARAYALIAKDGPDAFYRGPIGQAIVQAHERGRRGVDDARPVVVPVGMGEPDLDHLQGLRGLSDAAADAGLRDARDAEHPGAVRCAARLRPAPLGPRSPEFWHILMQAKRLAYTDLERYNGDPRFVHVPVNRLISKRYAASLCSRISLGHVSGEPAAAGKAAVSVTTRERGDTVYLTAADRWGNMVSFIYSIYDYFGASVSIPGYGFPMNDRGSFF